MYVAAAHKTKGIVSIKIVPGLKLHLLNDLTRSLDCPLYLMVSLEIEPKSSCERLCSPRARNFWRNVVEDLVDNPQDVCHSGSSFAAGKQHCSDEVLIKMRDTI